MRFWLHLGMISLCTVLAVWAYTMSGKTRATELEVARLKREIGIENERLAVLKAEWAYLNRPERLRYLVDLKRDELKLVPINEDSYSQVTEIPYMEADEMTRLPAIDLDQLENAVIALERLELGDAQ